MYNYYPLSHSSKINLYPVELVSIENLVVEQQNLGPGSKELLKESIKNWRKASGENMSFALKLASLERDSHQIIFNNDGLMDKFASLKTIKDIEAFSMKYGLLGITHPDNLQVNSNSPAIMATLEPPILFTKYDFSVFEPIELWQWHIDEVRRILRLYHTARKANSEELLYEVIEIKLHSGRFGSLAEDREITERYFVYWTNGEVILMLPKEFEEKSMLDIAQYTLAKILELRISGGINLGPGEVISNTSTKEFTITEQRYSKYLLAAIYYDLWQTINNSKNVYLCENRNCRFPFVKSGRKKYCNEACKQEAYRIRIVEKGGKE
ncbi:hypothetical protein ELQ35_15585 [Peribacillus cavernae]|uniref:CGNR zinc finger domain-containing protein n=1 Tax=Peribacillus cavernae TaxID=1674310 RepID=A0A3S0TZ22_9BACI|nr:hypothetical protein [Peribacillus cavernae]MDQ0221367.1 hypothetical protein [Peribacillus cavernae]RUQ27519.1 hypothetical protein ELQ35_15585 [Peribacillus cavernae]